MNKKMLDQIKEWEIAQDFITDCLLNLIESFGDELEVNRDGEGKVITLRDLLDESEMLSHEMMAINI